MLAYLVEIICMRYDVWYLQVYLVEIIYDIWYVYIAGVSSRDYVRTNLVEISHEYKNIIPRKYENRNPWEFWAILILDNSLGSWYAR